MKIGLLLILTFLVACSQAPVRSPASIVEIQYEEVDTNKSLIRVFPPQIHDKNFHHFFFLELKDKNGKLVDCDPADIRVKQPNGKKVTHKLERSNKGKYYVTLEESADNGLMKVNIFVGSKPLQEAKLFFKKADRNKSWMKSVRSSRQGMRMKLFLGDTQGKAVEVPSIPEIILDGQAGIENLERVGEGTWEFDLIYPNYNQVIYVSVRAHGILMADMFRVQHIEK